MNDTVHTDIAIIGGGIAGLWLINILQQQGFSCVVIENNELGGEQTLLSQGIIHGGLKYALGGTLSSESESIAGMPDRWRKNLSGEGEIDLRRAKILSDTQHLWSAGSMASRFTTFFASKMLRGRINKLKFDNYPTALRNKRFKGNVYCMDDLVVDTSSLLAALVEQAGDRFLKFDDRSDKIIWNDSGVESIQLAHVNIQPRITILAAGAGTGALLNDAHQHDVAKNINVQLRPLQMLLVQHNLGHRLYAHCIGASNKPRLTITTHDATNGDLVWYLGGDIAERGVDMMESELIAAGRSELNQLFPWLDFSEAVFSGVRIDRAEPKQDSLIKPDNAYAMRDKNLIVTWPTKLTLAPDLGDRVMQLLEGFLPSEKRVAINDSTPRARIANAKWETSFVDHDGTTGHE
ncbi:MAG: FAD-dependent oxidoreductase [Alcanivoracaceae bacterium]|nr:FAD-dependent oxidoreductase [Alcanivoracaceae bacterium]